MKISIVLPSNRTSNQALARIFEMASLDPNQFEVIVRDNSEDAHKARVLGDLQNSAVHVTSVPGKGPFENTIQAFRRATGEFILPFADDDWLFARGLVQLHSMAKDVQDDASIVGLTGMYLVESSRGSGSFSYEKIDDNSGLVRTNAYLHANVANYLYYSAIRASVARFSFGMLESLPLHLSFHDQLMSLSYLAHGRFISIPRLLYSYDIGEWETMESTLAKDRAMYAKAGLPREIDRLHWLICGLEGALLMRSRGLRASVGANCAALGDTWFQFMHRRFVAHDREVGLDMTALGAGSAALRKKWMAAGDVDFSELLMDLSDVIGIENKLLADKYFSFWSEC